MFSHAVRCCAVWLALVCIPFACVADPAPDEIVLPRLDAAPTIDGQIDDPVWAAAAVAEGFTLPLNTQSAPKACRALLGFTDAGIHVGICFDEPDPAGLKTDSEDGSMSVWKDDCIEIWIRTTDRQADYDQFIVNAAGARQRVSSRVAGQSHPEPEFPAATQVGADYWTLEALLPFAEIGLTDPQPGDMIQLKLGREDPTGRTTVLTVWPPRAPYGAGEGYGRAYFVTSNLMPNADFTRVDENGQPAGWSFAEGQLERIEVVDDNGRQALHWQVPGSYTTISRSIQLEPNALYRLEGWLRGSAAISLRSRTKERVADEASRPFTVSSEPSEEYAYYSVTFPTGEDGSALIILGNTEGLGVGDVYLADLALSRESEMQQSGPAIPLTPGETLRVTDVAISDCRALRGFVGAPVDGRLDSVAWNGSTWEYGAPHAGAGVYYDFAGGDGLNITLADDLGVDAVQIRGGAKVKLYRDAASYFEPGDADPVWNFPTNSVNSRALFPDRVDTDRFSFFDLKDGFLSDLYFFRIGETTDLPEPTLLSPGPAASPEDLLPFANRFGDEPGPFLSLTRGSSTDLQTTEDGWLHFVTEPMSETGMLAVGLKLNMPAAPAGMPLTVAVMDPFSPSTRAMSADFTAEGPGELHVILDHLDQVIPEGRRVWIALNTGAATELTDATVELYLAPRERAVAEALQYRTWIVKTMFASLSEPRPWGSLRSRDTDLDEWAKAAYAGEKIVELLHEAGFAKALGPDDDTIRQYDEWLWRNAGIPDFEPVIDDVPGAPEWAVVLHQAWLAAREIPRWWIENRLVETGELGGRVGDDSDMYQNWAMFPVISDDPVAQHVLKGAAALAEHAEATTMEAGLNKRSTDPLHAYEEGVNHEAIMAWWEYGDPVYFERCLLASQSMPALTTVTDLGHRHFKSQSVGAEDLRIDRPTDQDGHAHPLMLHPCFEVLWYNRHPQVERFLREWADGWLEHQQPGDYVTSVEVATEKPMQTYDTRPLYGGYGSQSSAFASMFLHTGDQKYLRPLMDFYTKGQAPMRTSRSVPEFYQAGALSDLSAEALDGLAELEPYLAVLRGGDKQSLIDALKGDITEMQRFPHMYTTAEQFTDRIFLYAIQNAAKAYTGAYATRNKFEHPHSVSWEGLGTDFAALVVDADPDRLKVLVYNFADAPLQGAMRVWRLDHGIYQVKLGPDADGDDQADGVTTDQQIELMRATRVPVLLPPGQTTVVELSLQQPLDDIRNRADLALSPIDTTVDAGTVHGVVHNIGVAAVDASQIVLIDPGGQTVATQSLTAIPGIGDDLEAVRVPFELAGLPADSTGWRVVIDLDDRIPEIYEGNNELTFDASGLAR